MTLSLHFPVFIFFSLAASFLNAAERNSDPAKSREKATRLQVFLDRANFGPGKIDGRDGDFTRKALALYRESHAPAENVALTGVDPVFIDYQVTEADLKDVGEVSKEIPEMAKLKWLPYTSAAEAIAEKFHCDLDFLRELNSGKLEAIKPGDVLKVPNVEPFDIASVKASKAEDQPAKKESAEGSTFTIVISTSDNMLRLLDDGKLVAAYPVTIGSEQTQSPGGDWKIRSIARWPDFRYDQSFLDTGVRGEEKHLLPPGPNNLVGVIWIALDRPGIGIHGTSEPDSIGRSSSHGCVRMANWDVVRLAARVRPGVAVSIH